MQFFLMPHSVGPFELAAKAAFYVVAAGTLCGAWAAVSARNLFRAALGLAVALFGMALLYFYLEAEFLAVVQILVYVGAILTLLVFGVMLTHRIADPAVPRWNKQALPALALSAVFGFGLAHLLFHSAWEVRAGAEPAKLTATAETLLTTYLLPFEVLSVLLLGALAGALYIAKKEKG